MATGSGLTIGKGRGFKEQHMVKVSPPRQRTTVDAVASAGVRTDVERRTCWKCRAVFQSRSKLFQHLSCSACGSDDRRDDAGVDAPGLEEQPRPSTHDASGNAHKSRIADVIAVEHLLLDQASRIEKLERKIDAVPETQAEWLRTTCQSYMEAIMSEVQSRVEAALTTQQQQGTDDLRALVRDTLDDTEKELMQVRAQIEELTSQQNDLKRTYDEDNRAIFDLHAEIASVRAQLLEVARHDEPRTVSGNEDASATQEQSVYSIFFGNVGFEHTEEDVERALGEAGAVHSVKLYRDSRSGRTKRCGTASFSREEGYVEALRADLMCGDRLLRVRPLVAQRSATP